MVFESCHWPPTGLFAVSVENEFGSQDSLSQLAGNNSEQRVLVYFTATLHSDRLDKYARDDVAIFFNEKAIGYLSQSHSYAVRQILLKNKITAPTTCDAVIYGGGLGYDGRVYDCYLELDLNFELELNPAIRRAPTYPQKVAKSIYPVLIELTAQELFLEIPFMRRETLLECSVGDELDAWRPPLDEKVIIFANTPPIGPGSVVTVIERSRFPDLLQAWETFQYLTAHKIEDRTLIVRGHNNPPAPDPRYAFRENASVKVTLLQVDPNEAVPSKVAVISLHVDLLGNGKLMKDTDAYRTVIQLNDTGADSLRMIVEDSEVLISCKADLNKRALMPILGKLVGERPWGCLLTMQQFWPYAAIGEPLASICEKAKVVLNGEGCILADCQAVADVLLSHTGKTKRSQTYMVEMLRKYV